MFNDGVKGGGPCMCMCAYVFKHRMAFIGQVMFVKGLKTLGLMSEASPEFFFGKILMNDGVD